MRLPLRVDYGSQDGDTDTVYGIYDVDDKCIVETDAGFYGPNKEDAEFIVKAVNNYKAGESNEAK